TLTFPHPTTPTPTTHPHRNYLIHIPPNQHLKPPQTLPLTPTHKHPNTSQPPTTLLTHTTPPTLPSLNPLTTHHTQITPKPHPPSTLTLT
ncbi:hypothetical protein, partial [Staphylococcus warneri]|uniref:hypothetical protein n=1 Tax=Staphylococcus warneri TaxID=1292 RepID=UPI001C965C20